MAKTVRVGIIGAGAVAEAHHLWGFDRIPEVEVVAIADPNLDRAEAMAAEHDIPIVCEEAAALLAREDLDAVSICTPNALHAEQAMAAIMAGRHVLCEAPLALRPGQCRELIAAARERGVVLMPACPCRFSRPHLRARELLAAGAIGQPFLFRARFANDGPEVSGPGRSDWVFDPRLAGGGALLGQGLPALDLFGFYLGQAAWVSAEIHTLSQSIPVEDDALCVVHGSGGLGRIEASWCCVEPVARVEVYGSEGVLAVDERSHIGLISTGAGWKPICEPGQSGVLALLRHFTECCLRGTPPLVTGEDALQAVALAHAAYEAAHAGRRVAISPGTGFQR